MINRFSERLRKLREDKNISQKVLSEYLGYGTTAVSAYENGRNEPPFDILIQIARYFDVTVDYLIGKEDRAKWPDSLTKCDWELLQCYRKLTAEEKILVLALIKALKKEEIL